MPSGFTAFAFTSKKPAPAVSSMTAIKVKVVKNACMIAHFSIYFTPNIIAQSPFVYKLLRALLSIEIILRIRHILYAKENGNVHCGNLSYQGFLFRADA